MGSEKTFCLRNRFLTAVKKRFHTHMITENRSEKRNVMGILSRKLSEMAAGVYRQTVLRFKKLNIEIKKKSIFKPGVYIRNADFEGRNFLGKNTSFVNGKMGFGSYINRDGDFSETDIGRYSSIGANVSTVVGRHPIEKQLAMHPAFTDPTPVFGFSYAKTKTFGEKNGRITIGNDVWIGNHVKILDGVKIADGAVIGAGAVVTKDIPPYAVAAGIPAKVIKYRFDSATIDELLRLKWWDKGEEWIREHIDEFADLGRGLSKMREV